MDNQNNAPIINEAAQTAHVWVNEVASGLDETAAKSAYHALRGVPFALGDRKMPEEAAHLGDQLPTLIRGIYYEGYKHGGKPEKIRDIDSFLAEIEHETGQTVPAPDPGESLRVVTSVLVKHIDAGQYGHVKNALPLEIQECLEN